MEFIEAKLIAFQAETCKVWVTDTVWSPIATFAVS